VIVPGGYAPDRMRRNAAMLKLVRDSFTQGKIVAAICHAGVGTRIRWYRERQESYLRTFDQRRHDKCRRYLFGPGKL